jgi:hypothetical protein
MHQFSWLPGNFQKPIQLSILTPIHDNMWLIQHIMMKIFSLTNRQNSRKWYETHKMGVLHLRQLLKNAIFHLRHKVIFHLRQKIKKIICAILLKMFKMYLWIECGVSVRFLCSQSWNNKNHICWWHTSLFPGSSAYNNITGAHNFHFYIHALYTFGKNTLSNI